MPKVLPHCIPRVSVIIPTYNRAWILQEAVESVLDQDFEGFELIVVDDGSTDETAAILDGYGDRLTVIHSSNRGVSAARNTGIRAAAGRLIAFLDSDDLWLPGKLAEQVTYLEDHPRRMICQSEEIWIRNGVRVNPARRHRKPSGDIFEPSLERCLVSPSAVMLRRSLLDEVGLFDEQLPACEDYDLWLRVACRWPVDRLDRPRVVKRGGHPDQLSRQPCLDKYRIRSLVKILENESLRIAQYNAAVLALRRKCAVYGNGCLKRGRLEEAGRYARLAKKYHLKAE
jgi:glycosyltransferase involved in cell wall biosynthesis